MPETPSSSLFHTVATPVPNGEQIPRPVTTTRRAITCNQCKGHLGKGRGYRVLQRHGTDDAWLD